MSDRARDYIFGYASLAAGCGWSGRGPNPGLRSRGRIARLGGFGRTWNVAMDNSVDIPGYKHYRAPDGERPSVFVTFLNIVARSGMGVNGVLLPVDAADLGALDARERNYDRTDVTSAVVNAPPGRVWAYSGKREARERYERGVAASRAVVSERYYRGVIRDFGRLGGQALADFVATTVAPACPIVDLERVDHAGGVE